MIHTTSCSELDYYLFFSIFFSFDFSIVNDSHFINWQDSLKFFALHFSFAKMPVHNVFWKMKLSQFIICFSQVRFNEKAKHLFVYSTGTEFNISLIAGQFENRKNAEYWWFPSVPKFEIIEHQVKKKKKLMIFLF